MGQKVEGGNASQGEVMQALSGRGAVVKQVVMANPVLCPTVLAHIWGWFVELNNERGSNGFGANPITSTAIKDWCWATGNNPQKWEIGVIRKLDSLWLVQQNKTKPSK